MTLLRTDDQTIEDLGIFGKRSGEGIYDIYNRACTKGGEALLEELFRHPLSDGKTINTRCSIIENFARLAIRFPYEGALFDIAEKYLTGAKEGTGGKAGEAGRGEKETQNGVGAVIDLIQNTRKFIENESIKSIAAYAGERAEIARLLADPAFDPVTNSVAKTKLSFSAVTAYDGLFSGSVKEKIIRLLHYIYRLDVYISVAETAAEKGFCFPKTLEGKQAEVKLEGVYHPKLHTPVGNDIRMNESHNVVFLTGANMAGKSTFLRSLSTALYVAHIGFPVAARSMAFSVMDGIYTTINLPDNLGIGASHFYVEVLRVKQMAKELSTGKSYFILFDELFRGTNVKDAHEATVAVTNGFATKTNSLFIISSHIVEAGEALKQKSNVSFLYLPTKMNGHIPAYTYKLEHGITDDRHGMIIINKEGILETLKNGKQTPFLKRSEGPTGPGTAKDTLPAGLLEINDRPGSSLDDKRIRTDNRGRVIAKKTRWGKSPYYLIPVLLLAAAWLFRPAPDKSPGFMVQGEIGRLNAPAQAYLVYETGTGRSVDSVVMDDGTFEFKGSVPEPTAASLVLDHRGVGLANLNASNADFLKFYLNNETIKIKSGDLAKTAVVSGSEINDALARYNAFLGEHTKNTATTAALAQYIQQNPSSFFCLVALDNLMNLKENAATIDSLYKTLPADLQNTVMGNNVAKKIATMLATSIGASAPVFGQPDAAGKIVRLTDFAGKYLLIDFWASWCKPCRIENPNVVKAYATYHPKGLEIVGISLDDAGHKQAWLNAIQHDGLAWVQVSDLKGAGNEAALLYGIRSIPQNFLIDPDGKIVATNLRGEELGKKLEEIFNK